MKMSIKGTDILNQEIRSHDEAVALMQQGSVLMFVGWWAKAKAIEYLVKESGLSFSKWHEKNFLNLGNLNTASAEAMRQQAWQEVKWLDTNGVSENDLPKVENHAYRLRNVDDADKHDVWMDFTNSDDKVPQWDKVTTTASNPAEVIVKVSVGGLFSQSKLLIPENQAKLVDSIISFMMEHPVKKREIIKTLNKWCNDKF